MLAASNTIASPALLMIPSMILATFAAGAVEEPLATLDNPHDSIGRRS